MDGPGDQLLAGTAFAENEDTAVGGRHFGNLFKDIVHGRTPADHLVSARDLPTELQILFLEGPTLQGILYGDEQFFFGNRLFDEIVGTFFGGGDGVLHCGVAGNHHHHDVRMFRLHLFQQFESVGAGHDDIEENQINRAGLQDVPGFCSVRS